MKPDTREDIKKLLEQAEQVRSDVYDYDGDVLWCLDNAITAIKNILR